MLSGLRRRNKLRRLNPVAGYVFPPGPGVLCHIISLGSDITVRVIDENGRLAWITIDVCRALGVTNAADAVKGLDDDEQGIATICTPGGRQQMIVVYESGLYALILRSRKEAATRFRKWITSEVIPSIRQNGTYTVPGFATYRKPYAEWSMEDVRVNLAQVDTARRSLSRGAAAWMWENLGFPIPPRHLLPGWWQGNLVG
jgi:prophage antirepressor-like protein